MRTPGPRSILLLSEDAPRFRLNCFENSIGNYALFLDDTGIRIVTPDRVKAVQADARPRRFHPQMVLETTLSPPGPGQCVSSDKYPLYPSFSSAAICPFQSTCRVPTGPHTGVCASMWQSLA